MVLSRLFGRRGAREQGQNRAAPERGLKRLSLATSPAVTYAVGDVHGHDGLYRALEARLVADAARFDGPALLVLLGDVIDRGPRSAELIDHLIESAPKGITRVTLMGNHEDMFRRFLDDPDEAREWIGWGGAQTLASYGLHPDPERGYNLSGHALRAKVEACVPSAHRRFFAGLPLSVTLPDYVLSHAGGNGTRDWEAQGKDDLIWSDPRALTDGVFGRTVVHGHVPVARVDISPMRIAVDTGAYESGVLSAVRLCPGAAPVVFSQGHNGPIEGPDLSAR